MTKKIRGKKTKFAKASQTTMGFCEACNDQTELTLFEDRWLCGECIKYGERKSPNKLGRNDMSFGSNF